MKRLITLGALLGAFSLAACAAPPAAPEPDTDAMLAAAEDLDVRFVAAFNTGDTEALASMYWNSPDTASFPPDAMIMRGHGEIQAAYASMIDSAGTVLELTEKHHSVEGNVVLSWGLWTITTAGPDGEPMEIHGRFTDVKAERDGSWVYLMDHASVPLPPPPDGGN
jgi:ketosteroid isomerase-like protein